MPYYMMRGDYYRGDYYRGDPGLFSAIGGLFKGIGRGLGIIGPPAQKVIIESGMPAASRAITLSGRAGSLAREAAGTLRRHPAATTGAAAGVAGLAGAALESLRGPAGAMRGFHISRRTGKLVRNRRMRVTNVKALHRSLRRIGGFARIARRVLHFTHPRLARGRPHFRFKRKTSR